MGLDTDAARIAQLAQGVAPFHEQGLSDLGFLFSAVEALLPSLGTCSVVVAKSSVPVGTAVGTAALDAVYGPLLEQGTPRIVINFATVELVKVAASSFLAVKLSYSNAVAQDSAADACPRTCVHSVRRRRRSVWSHLGSCWTWPRRSISMRGTGWQ